MILSAEENCALSVGTRVRLHSALYDVTHRHPSGGGCSSSKRYAGSFIGTITANKGWHYEVKPDGEEYWTLTHVLPKHIIDIVEPTG